MTEQAKVPAIRFAGFTDPWEQRKFSNLTDRVSMQSSDPDLPQVEYEDIVSGEGTLNKDLRDKEGGKTGIKFYAGDVLYGKLRPYLMNWLYPQFNGVAVGDFWVLRATECDSSFLYRLVQTDSFQRLANVSSGSKMPRADWNLISQSFFAVPADYAEQRVIAKSLAELDDLITLHQRKYDKLVIFKKSMLEKMFPKDGESVPEIRFAGFTDPWEQRKLGEIVSIGAGAPPSAFSAGNFLYVKVDDLNESSHFQFDSAQRVDANTAVKPIRKGSIIFAKRGAAILGNKVRVLGKTAYIDTNMMALEPRGVDADFLWLFINQTGLYRIADTSTIPQINNKHIEPYPVDIPNMAEQQAIGTFFSRLDDLITLHQRKLELLQDIKKSLLDKMFV